MDPREAIKTAEGLGFTLPSAAYIFGAILFGLVGYAAFRMGRKQQRTRAVLIGLALMLYPYFISQTWLMYVVGATLCVGLWIERRY